MVAFLFIFIFYLLPDFRSCKWSTCESGSDGGDDIHWKDPHHQRSPLHRGPVCGGNCRFRNTQGKFIIVMFQRKLIDQKQIFYISINNKLKILWIILCLGFNTRRSPGYIRSHRHASDSVSNPRIWNGVLPWFHFGACCIRSL